jgi:tRNA-specific 2-thiouridylase
MPAMHALHGNPVIVALSGGVDSAVAALRLVQAGAAVQALYMENWDATDEYCTSAQDYQDARAVARELGIVLHRVNFTSAYRERVFADFLAAYAAGRTPNPDVLCNREIKFDLCTAHARRLGARFFATGHYARLRQDADGPALLKAVDIEKDQSYFLHAVPRAEFTDVLFPLGELHKQQVRDLAREAGLPVCNKPDSTGICFIGERPFAEFLARYIPDSPGPIETLRGERLATHRGLPFYTLGQREGLLIGGTAGHAPEPWYVVRKDTARNALVVAQRHERESLECRRLRTTAANWLAARLTDPWRAAAKIRYRQPDQSVMVQPLAGEALELCFELPQRAATVGQYAVLYDGERCLGGAQIAETL